MLDAAAHAGVSRLVFISSIATAAQNPDGPATEEHVFDDAPGSGVYHDLKWTMERQVLEEDRMETVVLCPGACLGPWDMRIGTSAMLVGVARGERVPHPDGWINICDARDVAQIALAVGQMDSPPRRLLLSASNHRLHELLTLLAQRYGVPAPPEPLSDADAIRLADAAERRAMEEGGRADISRELVDLTIHGHRVDASFATRLTGFEYRSLETTLQGFERWAHDRRIIPNSPHVSDERTA